MLSALPNAQELCGRFKAIANIGTPHQQLNASSLKRLVSRHDVQSSDSNCIDWVQHCTTVEDINKRFEQAKFPLKTVSFYEHDQIPGTGVHNFQLSGLTLRL
jgi:hypothetical protein